ncbi:hypothetical protein CJ196_05450 [Bifidobacterium breve]|uniref:hypothetical protein n=1 Tax=Bifidobacterium TaxID=1678 RepID=UPI000C779174|nr:MULTISPECIES: hypothetical protein [Bifidobacterium]MDN4190520.1 hypothetical protein [Bifidobacterium longum subsp. longum]PKY88902.1 hypothetical protein CYJ38_06035 [Bifidobacterium breve]PMC73300.1 hypothetical protein CJ196_05450 [Bifidobacterium breve]
MNGVYGKRVKQLDVRLVRGDSERLGGRWRQRNLVTDEVTGKDLTGWSGRVELRSPDGVELWYSKSCDEVTDDGYAVANLPPSAFDGDIWLQRRSGQWKCVVTSPDGGTVRTVGWGCWILSD